MSGADHPKHANRLIHESSPYLLQHAHNPVDWYAWGPEAFEAARKQNKPIFLSVGYSTCYWCHVMERQSFENEAIAAEMNRLFISIKVDREERPDVDQLYMTAVQVQTRQGGWPMSVFLTPDLRYFYGGTYFPPTDAYGRPGFVTLLRAISDAYHNRRADVEDTANQFLEILRQAAQPAKAREAITIDQGFVDRMVERSTSDYEPRHGGFGGAPKFPRETLLELLLKWRPQPAGEGSSSESATRKSEISNLKSQISNIRSQISDQLRHTLDAMADGGIRDQLGGGFHRYSTDAEWLVPHFEIMLYDNAMLGWIYAEAHRQFTEPRYAEVARGIFDFILREMTSPDGAFYTAFDAEVDAQEGLSYLWTAEEIDQLLGPDDAKGFNRAYGVDLGPNFADPHHGHGAPDKNILFLPRPLSVVARELGTDPQSLNARLAPMRQKLHEARARRKQPLLDTKVITSWNALMIRALAHGGQILSEPRYIDAARRAAEFLLARHRTPDGGLYRTSRDGKANYDGFLDDYSFFIQSLLELRHGTGEPRWVDEAHRLAQALRERFGDPDAGGFFFTDRSATDLIVRQKTATDSPLPSGNAVAGMVLDELGHEADACQTLSLFAPQTREFGEGMSSMVQAMMQYIQRHGSFTVEPGGAARPGPAASPQQTAAQAVSVRTQWRNPRALAVYLDIVAPFHINAHDVAGAEIPLIPTSISVAGENVDIIYPPAEERRFPFSETPLRVYSGTVEILVRFQSDRKGTPVRLALSYQACNEQACLPPVTKQIES